MMVSILKGCHRFLAPLNRGANLLGGDRWSATTGYFRSRLRREYPPANAGGSDLPRCPLHLVPASSLFTASSFPVRSLVSDYRISTSEAFQTRRPEQSRCRGCQNRFPG